LLKLLGGLWLLLEIAMVLVHIYEIRRYCCGCSAKNAQVLFNVKRPRSIFWITLPT